ncbi:MAG TPA: ABC transporter substrate-binding protein [Mycobacteriales bacterium]|jgi:peptide/nickel transport system substrate-binding protein|nr:ABC transporter substrate-binding protein [Mycobacteriales bacterium]
MAAAAVLLTACGNSSSGANAAAAKVDNVDVVTELAVNNLDGLNSGSITVTKAIYSYLVYVDPTGKLAPDVAERWTPSADATTWVFDLFPDQKFSDGSPLTADDVVFSVKTILANPKSTQSPYVSLVAAIDKTGDNQVTVKLKSPSAAWPRQATALAVVPAATYNADTFKTKPVAGGPYTVVSYNGTDRVVLKANPLYRGAKPAIENASIQYVGDQTTRLSGLQSGQFDLATLSGPEVTTAEQAGLVVQSTQSARVDYLGYNVTLPGLDSQKLRQAISYAVDRKSLVGTLLEGRGEPANQLFGESTYGYDPSIQVPAQDVARAKQLVQESGYTGQEILFEYPATSYVPNSAQMAQAIGGYLNAIGIKVKLAAVQDNTFLTNFLAKKLSGMYLFSATTSSLDGGGTFNFNVGIVNSFTDPELTALQKQQTGEVDSTKRQQLMGQISRIINDKAYYTPLFVEQNNYVHSKEISLSTPPAHGYSYPQLVVPAS